jgi:hypothetical protein
MRSIEYQHLVLLLLSVINFYTTDAKELCPLCSSVTVLPINLGYVLDPNQNPPYKCYDAWYDLAQLVTTDAQCAPLQDQYRALCCTNSAAPPNTPSNPNPPAFSESGDQPMCRICKDDDYPGNPQHVITARYVGTYNCGSLYNRGRNGLIPGFMCGPLQDFAHSVCQCGEEAQANPPVPVPVQPNPPVPVPATRDPSPDPTPDPSPDPTPDPSPDPSPAPVEREYYDLTPTAIGARKKPPDVGNKAASRLYSPNRYRNRDGNRVLRGGNEKQSNPMESEEPLEV